MTKHISKNELLEIIDKNICGDESTAERRAGKILNGINRYKKEKTFREKRNEVVCTRENCQCYDTDAESPNNNCFALAFVEEECGFFKERK